MAEYTLHININNIPGDNNTKAKEKLEKTTNGDNTGSGVSDKLENLKKAAKAVGAISLGKQVLGIGKQELNYRISTYGAKYGDTARQNELQNMMSIANSGVSLAKNTVSGAVAGATLGPAGAIVGAVIGFVSDGLNQVMGMVHRSEEWSRQQYINNLNETRTSERLGLMKSDRQRGR